MESSGASKIFHRSIEQRGLKYMIMVGDGDTGCFGAVAKSLKEKYGDDYNITKEECVGHVQRRMGTSLREYKKKSRGKKLEQVNADLTKEIIELKKDFKKQGSELNNLQQYSRRECIEINGVPPTDDENTEEIVIHICKEIGVTVEKSDVVACHRVKTSKGDPYIITKFLNRQTKENVMRNRKNLKHKTVERLGFPAEENKKQNKVFINKSLTPRNKNLFRLVRLKADEMKWEFYWTKNGTVYAKKNENTAPAKISDFEDIAKKII